MPTPLVHLYVSQQILEEADGRVAALLRRRAGDFMLGSIAPDAWWLGGLRRADAHVLPIPIPPAASGVIDLLDRYPLLRDVHALSAPQAAYVAGYLTHLLLDEIWYHDIFHPFFLAGHDDVPVQRRLLLHNVLRLSLEDDLEERVSPAYLLALARARIDYALPPIPDATLAILRDRVSVEFLPGGEKQSADVFAQRMGAPVEDLLDILRSPARMKEEVFSRLPAGVLDQVLADAVRVGMNLLRIYLDGGAREAMRQVVVARGRPDGA
jgi:hypothetical protein